MLDIDLVGAEHAGELPRPDAAGSVAFGDQDDGLVIPGVGEEEPLAELGPLGATVVDGLFEHDLVGFPERFGVEARRLDVDDSGKSTDLR